MAAPTERLFVALDLPAAARAELAGFRDRAGRRIWRPVADDALHITLAFLGHLPEGSSERVGAVVRACAGPATDLALGAALLLPPRRPRVLTVEIEDGAGELGALQARLVEALSAAGVYEPERRAFRPHATVARLRAGERAPRELRIDGPGPLGFDGEAVTLYRSRLSRAGARYEPLERVPLG
jgi:2'-5' RNA ligase